MVTGGHPILYGQFKYSFVSNTVNICTCTYNMKCFFFTTMIDFVQVGIDEMVAKVKSLDSFTRQLVAPLGIVFPFPLHCSKLDCYMSPEHREKGELNT